MKQKTHDVGGPDNSTPETSGDGVLKDLAAKAAALAPALDTGSSDGDPRRRGEIKVVGEGARYFLGIDGYIWAEIDWAQGKGMWCIQDCCGYCLSHVPHQHADVANVGTPPNMAVSNASQLNPSAAIEKAKQMIRDGSMPSPEQAQKNFIKNYGRRYSNNLIMPK